VCSPGTLFVSGIHVYVQIKKKKEMMMMMMIIIIIIIIIMESRVAQSAHPIDRGSILSRSKR
jgi:accessory gene regulator protein AgrB